VKLNIAAVPIQMVELIWDKCVPHLVRVIDKAPNDINLESIKKNLLSGQTLMVTICDSGDVIAVNIMETCTYETGHKVMFIPIVGGDRLEEWMKDFLDIAHQIAREYGCQELRGMAVRKGWEKVLKSYGWHSVHTILGCDVKQIESNITNIKVGEL